MTTKSITKQLNTKAQVVIPIDLREKHNIKPKGFITLKIVPQGILIQPAKDPIDKAYGFLEGKLKETSLQIKDEIRKEESKYEK